MGVSSIFVQVPRGGAALAGWGRTPSSSSLAGLDLSLPEQQAHIDSGWLVGGAGELPLPGLAGSGCYLAAGETQRSDTCRTHSSIQQYQWLIL